MLSERQLVDLYTRRALQRTRVANGWNRAAQRDLRALSRELAWILSSVDLQQLGKRRMNQLLREVDEAVSATYGAIGARNVKALGELSAIEAAWTTQAAGLRRAASEAAIVAAADNLTVVGLPAARHWERQAVALSDRIAATVRTAAAAGQESSAVVRAVIGSGRQGRELGGLMGTARQQSATLINTSAHSAAYAGQMTAWKAGGINALKWHSILDTRTTIGCAARSGKLYTLEFEPIGHDIPIEALPPAHWGCRSILVGMRYDGPLPSDGHDPYSESLDDWLKRHSPEMQDEMLGVGRADAWRDGAITTRDLLGQYGQTLSLAELRAQIGD